MESNILASEQFSTGKRHFFLDFKLAANNTNFIQITRSDEQADGSFRRNHVNVFQEDFPRLIRGFPRCSIMPRIWEWINWILNSSAACPWINRQRGSRPGNRT
ncbi:DUF3276 family protein [Pedobacter sp. UC225_61]|uniref:DUF3276 family protein n=1 Tax=Pedobacter sp. UC225_61 TaxID=3374623 RepID=UPI0037A9FC88